MKNAVIFGAIALGFVLLIASSLWQGLFPATASWTEEKAQRASDIKARLSNIGPIVNSTKRTMHGGPDPATLKVEFDALEKENEQLNAEFQSAHDRPNTIAKILKWSGISLGIFGLIGWYAVKQTS